MRITKRRTSAFAVAMTLAIAPFALHAQGFPGGHKDALGSKYERNPGEIASAAQLLESRPRPTQTLERVEYWSTIALDTTGIDHSPVAPGETRVFGQQFGPGRSSRAMAIVHIAMYDAMQAVRGRYESYTGVEAGGRRNVNVDAAIAQAAHDTLVYLYSSQAPLFDRLLSDDLNSIRVDSREKAAGVSLGKRAAAAIIAQRSHDGSQYIEPVAGTEYPVSNLPGRWRPDPVSQIPLALGAYWGSVKPFTVDSAKHFRPPPPPLMGSPEYTRAFQQVLALGGDGVHTPTMRTEDQTRIGIFWAYDGTPSLCAPPRLFNQIVTHIAHQQGTNDPLDLLRLMALANIAIADAAMVAWDAKYTYNFWRPVTGVREASPGSGPTGAGDGNPDTTGVPDFMPLGAPASNLHGPNFTPPFPAYPSGHATLGGALFEVLRQYYHTDDIAFTFTSDELNGVTVDNQDVVSALAPRTFNTLSEAEHENMMSRVYLGVHWIFDAEAGVKSGNAIGRYVFEHALQRERSRGDDRD
jgi:hypothetical protein